MKSVSACTLFINKNKKPHVVVQSESFLQELVPTKGMQFTSYEAAWEFYNMYARHAGFGTRKRNGGYMNNYIVCSREGKNQETVSNYDRKRDKTAKRTDCKARIIVRTVKGVFVIAHVE